MKIIKEREVGVVSVEISSRVIDGEAVFYISLDNVEVAQLLPSVRPEIAEELLANIQDEEGYHRGYNEDDIEEAERKGASNFKDEVLRLVEEWD